MNISSIQASCTDPSEIWGSHGSARLRTQIKSCASNLVQNTFSGAKKAPDTLFRLALREYKKQTGKSVGKDDFDGLENVLYLLDEQEDWHVFLSQEIPEGLSDVSSCTLRELIEQAIEDRKDARDEFQKAFEATTWDPVEHSLKEASNLDIRDYIITIRTMPTSFSSKMQYMHMCLEKTTNPEHKRAWVDAIIEMVDDLHLDQKRTISEVALDSLTSTVQTYSSLFRTHRCMKLDLSAQKLCTHLFCLLDATASRDILTTEKQIQVYQLLSVVLESNSSLFGDNLKRTITCLSLISKGIPPRGVHFN